MAPGATSFLVVCMLGGKIPNSKIGVDILNGEAVRLPCKKKTRFFFSQMLLGRLISRPTDSCIGIKTYFCYKEILNLESLL